MVRINPGFAKFLHSITAQSNLKSLALLPIFIGISSSVFDQDKKQLYVAKILQAVIWLNGKFCKIPIDTRTEINMIIEKV